MTLGEYLRKQRQSKKLTLRETAKRAKMSSSYLSQLENGHNSHPNTEILRKLSEVLEVPYINLIGKTIFLEGEANAQSKMSGEFAVEKGTVNPEGSSVPNTIKKQINLPFEYKVNDGFKSFENSDLLDLYYLVHMGIDKNDVINLQFKGKPIDNKQMKKILDALHLILE